ncbi:MAG: VWA domain-containing protein [Acidobacteria bacterium]|nr:VWA domain-containing protein [Acidobacteriota bacterium]
MPALRLLFVAVVLAGVAMSTSGAAQQATFRAGTRTVPIYATVTDANGRLVPDLVRGDFEIYDNGRLQELTLFENTAQPISVVVMLDTSGSMTMHLDLLKQAATQFVIRLLPSDQARVGSFNDRNKILISPAAFTSDRDELMRALREDLQFGNPTALWDATDRSMDALADVAGRRVVLVFTDGGDNDSARNQKHVLTRAQAEEVMIYAIGLRAQVRGQGVTRPDPGLRRVADDTGGGYFELQRTDELNATFTRVVQELHSQYLLGFTPQALDGKVHTLEVRLTRPGLTTRARKSYVAK